MGNFRGDSIWGSENHLLGGVGVLGGYTEAVALFTNLQGRAGRSGEGDSYVMLGFLGQEDGGGGELGKWGIFGIGWDCILVVGGLCTVT